MNCKHIEIKGNTTKYYYCKVKEKEIEEKDCKNCMLKIPNIPKGFEEIFGKGFTRQKQRRKTNERNTKNSRRTTQSIDRNNNNVSNNINNGNSKHKEHNKNNEGKRSDNRRTKK